MCCPRGPGPTLLAGKYRDFRYYVASATRTRLPACGSAPYLCGRRREDVGKEGGLCEIRERQSVDSTKKVGLR